MEPQFNFSFFAIKSCSIHAEVLLSPFECHCRPMNGEISDRVKEELGIEQAFDNEGCDNAESIERLTT
jgi:hypothetical protein